MVVPPPKTPPFALPVRPLFDTFALLVPARKMPAATSAPSPVLPGMLHAIAQKLAPPEIVALFVMERLVELPRVTTPARVTRPSAMPAENSLPADEKEPPIWVLSAITTPSVFCSRTATLAGPLPVLAEKLEARSVAVAGVPVPPAAAT